MKKRAIPCVIFGIDQLEMNLSPQSENSWAMNELDFSTCKLTADTCAVLDDDFHLTLPVDVLGQEYAAKLSYTGHFTWQLADAYPVTADNTIILRPSTPNINGRTQQRAPDLDIEICTAQQLAGLKEILRRWIIN